MAAKNVPTCQWLPSTVEGCRRELVKWGSNVTTWLCHICRSNDEFVAAGL